MSIDVPKLKDLMEKYPQLNDEYLQRCISNYVAGEKELFAKVGIPNQTEILHEIEDKGITEIINQATNQTDIMSDLQKQSVKSISHFTDRETGEVIEVTDQMRQRAFEVQGFIKGSFFLLAEGLAAMSDEKLYGVFGYDSFRDYCKAELSFGVRQAYNYALIGRKIGHYAQLTDGNNESVKSISHLEGLGTTKLSEIIKRAEDQVGRLVSEGKIQMGDDDVSTDDIAEKTVRQLRQELKETKEKAEKADQMEYKAKLLEKENEDLQEDKKELLKNQDHIEKQEEIKEAIRQIDDHVSKALQMLGAIDLDSADDKTAQDHAAYVNMIQDKIIAHKEENLDLFEAYGDESTI